ncbi:hypothetical protein ABPG72_007161 [Tetrahymena utriculariae]
MRQNKYDEAIQLCNQVLQNLKAYNSPSNQQIFYWSYYLKGQSNYNSGRYDEAIKSFEESIKYDPKCVSRYAYLCQCYFLTQQYDFALKYSEVVLNSDKYEYFPAFIDIKVRSLIKLNREIEAKKFLKDLMNQYLNSKLFPRMKQDCY